MFFVTTLNVTVHRAVSNNDAESACLMGPVWGHNACIISFVPLEELGWARCKQNASFPTLGVDMHCMQGFTQKSPSHNSNSEKIPKHTHMATLKLRLVGPHRLSEKTNKTASMSGYLQGSKEPAFNQRKKEQRKREQEN